MSNPPYYSQIGFLSFGVDRGKFVSVADFQLSPDLVISELDRDKPSRKGQVYYRMKWSLPP